MSAVTKETLIILQSYAFHCLLTMKTVQLDSSLLVRKQDTQGEGTLLFLSTFQDTANIQELALHLQCLLAGLPRHLLLLGMGCHHRLVAVAFVPEVQNCLRSTECD